MYFYNFININIKGLLSINYNMYNLKCMYDLKKFPSYKYNI